MDATRLSSADFAQLRLQKAACVAFVRERWPLVALRRTGMREPSVETVALPAAHAEAQHWLVMRRGQGHFVAKLEPLAYRLYTTLAQRSVGEALGALEASCAPRARGCRHGCRPGSRTACARASGGWNRHDT